MDTVCVEYFLFNKPGDSMHGIVRTHKNPTIADVHGMLRACGVPLHMYAYCDIYIDDKVVLF